MNLFKLWLLYKKRTLKNNIMKKQVKSQFDEVNNEKFYSEYVLIDSSIINSVEITGASPQLDSGIIFG